MAPKRMVWCYSATMAASRTFTTGKKPATTAATKAAKTKKEQLTGVAPVAPRRTSRTPRTVALRNGTAVASSPLIVSGPAWEPSRRAQFLVDILGNKLVAELLQVAESQPSQWRRAKEVPGPQVAPLVMDLDHVVGRLLLIWDPSVIGDWLRGSNAFLEGARPIDVLVLRGSTPVIEAIEAEAQGAYAVVLLYRIFPHLGTAAEGEPGHALHTPPIQGAARWDNPSLYLCRYLATSPVAAIGEAFGNLERWSMAMLSSPSLPSAQRCLGTYCFDEEANPLLDLDDARMLLDRSIRPTHIVIRNLPRTQGIAAGIYNEGRWAGIQWWSYHRPQWTLVALWGAENLTVERIEAIPGHPALTDAAAVLDKSFVDI